MNRNNIVLATDNNYALHACVAMESVIRNGNLSDVTFYVLCTNLDDYWKKKIENVTIKGKSRVEFIDVVNIEDKLNAKLAVNSLSLSTYNRLLLPQILPENIDTVLYIDCDVVVVNELNTLLQTDITLYDVGAVEDTMFPNMKTSIGLKNDDLYFNAGVLLINLNRWRKNNYLEEFVKFIGKYDGKVPHLDQGVLNGVLKSRLVLPLKFNVQAPIFAFHKYNNLLRFFRLKKYYSSSEFITAKSKPTIVHFTSFYLHRPWFKFCLHPLKHEYIDLAKSIFPNFSTSNEAKISKFEKLKAIAFVYFQTPYLAYHRKNFRKIN